MTTSDKIKESAFQTIVYLVFITYTILCFYPFYYMFLVSVSDSLDVAYGKVIFLPSKFSLGNYYRVFQLKGIGNAFLISLSRSVVGTFFTVIVSALFAYTVTKKNLFARKFMYRATIFTMYANAGLIPWFITMKYLGLGNNYLLYILPYVMSPFGVILIKTYIESISPSIEESAHVDGAGYLTIFFKIIIPLSIPVLAAVAVFSAVMQWSQWQDNFFLVSKANLRTLQLMLVYLLKEAESLIEASDPMNLAKEQNIKLNPLAIKTTIAVVITVPIIMVYPFMQRFFLKGIMIGSVKG